MIRRFGEKKPAGNFDGPRALRREEHDSAIKLINSTLRPNGPASIFREYPLVLGIENMENMRVIVMEGQVISHAAIYFSKLRAGDLVFKVGGIGSVATHPAYRGRGLASAVIRDCIEIMERRQCHLSILWTQRHDFYRNLGYETAGSEYLFRAKTSDFARISCDCRIVPYSREHLPAVMDIHEREIFRTERRREEYETCLGIPKTRALLSMRGDEISAYMVMGKGEDFRDCAHEWGGDAKDLLCLTRELTRLSTAGEIIILAPAEGNDFTRLLRKMQIPEIFEYLAMMRIIDVGAVSEVLQSRMSSGLGKDFQIRRGDSAFHMRVGQEEVVLDQPQRLVRILFGPGSPSSLLQGFSRETLRALDKVLPLPLFIWGLDSV